MKQALTGSLGFTLGFLALILFAVPASAGKKEVTFPLPVPSEIDLVGKTSFTIAPCLTIVDEGQERVSETDMWAAFERYVSRLINRRAGLRYIESGPVDYPTWDIAELSRDLDFWAFLGERTQADLVIACSLDFEVQDRSGYRTEEYVSPFDGGTYYRQILVENTGFKFDIVLQVYDGKTGEQLYTNNFKDFRELDQGNADPMQGMFYNLVALEENISGIFSQRSVPVKRVLYTP